MHLFVLDSFLFLLSFLPVPSFSFLFLPVPSFSFLFLPFPSFSFFFSFFFCWLLELEILWLLVTVKKHKMAGSSHKNRINSGVNYFFQFVSLSPCLFFLFTFFFLPSFLLSFPFPFPVLSSFSFLPSFLPSLVVFFFLCLCLLELEIFWLLIRLKKHKKAVSRHKKRLTPELTLVLVSLLVFFSLCTSLFLILFFSFFPSFLFLPFPSFFLPVPSCSFLFLPFPSSFLFSCFLSLRYFGC